MVAPGFTSTLSQPSTTTYHKVRVGLIGCGDVAQVVHIPTLNHMSEKFTITYLCDVSAKAMELCRSKVGGDDRPQMTKVATELCASEIVDVVFVLSSDEYHVDHAVLALQHGKFVFVEKPLALNMRDVDRLREAEKASKGKVMVGYMRRYAAAFVDGVREIGGIEKISYARVRDIIGPNSVFIDQSGTFPKRFDDIESKDVEDRKQRASEMVQQGLEVESGVRRTDESTLMWRLLGGLGSHDISAMREALGKPTTVLGAYLRQPIWNVLFRYPGFAVSYESGIDSVPRFDAHIEIYSQHKTVRMQWDNPWVKGLPTTLHIAENVDDALKETTIRRTYEDPYTLEMKELYEWLVNGKPVKTTIDDARHDQEIFQMIMKAGAANK